MRYILVLLAPVVVLCLLVLSFFLLVIGDWMLSGILFLFTIIINLLTESFAFGMNEKTEIKSESFSVMTYNLNRAYITSLNNGTEEDVVEFILSQNVDLLCLQEFNPLVYKKIGDDLRFSYPYGSIEGENSRFKSVYSKYPIEDFQQLSLDGETLPICSMNIRVGDKQCRVVNCHFMSNNFSVVFGKIKNEGCVTLAHIKEVFNNLLKGYEARKRQAEILIHHIRQFEIPVLVCGDLNDVGGSAVLRLFKKANLQDAWWQKGTGFGFSFWGLMMRFRLDHFLFRKGMLSPKQIKVIHSKLSDHRPIIASFNFE